MLKTKTKKELQEIFNNIETALSQLSDDDLIDTWNVYKRSINDNENIIHYINDINEDEKVNSLTPYEILEICENVSIDDKYYYDDGFTFTSFNDIYEVYDEYELINAMIDNCDSYGVPEVDYILHERY